LTLKKKIGMALAFIAAISVVEVDAGSLDQSMKMCAAIADGDGVTMKARQEGVSLARLLDALDQIKGTGEHSEEMHLRDQRTALTAFEEPAFDTLEYQENAISDFKDRSLLQCLRCREKTPESLECFFQPVE
jgi:hypothetical protein